jgi:DNA polymerase/3'-5' exonuclease PolX
MAENPYDIHVAGSFRRGNEVCNDIDILCSKKLSNKLLTLLDELDPKAFTLEHETDGDVVKRLNIFEKGSHLTQLDIKIVSKLQMPYALVHYTGSLNFNIALRSLANRKGLSLNEYGFKFRDEDKRNECVERYGDEFVRFTGAALKVHEPLDVTKKVRNVTSEGHVFKV